MEITYHNLKKITGLVKYMKMTSKVHETQVLKAHCMYHTKTDSSMPLSLLKAHFNFCGTEGSQYPRV